MNVVQIITFAMIYMVSALGIVVVSVQAHAAGVTSDSDKQQALKVAFVPALNTAALLLWIFSGVIAIMFDRKNVRS